MKIPVTIRLDPEDIEKLEKMARQQESTLNRVIAGLVKLAIPVEKKIVKQ